RTRILDAFAVIDRDAELLVRYPVELDPAQRERLAGLVASMSYLGRAESWVEARLLTMEEATALPGQDDGGWTLPLGDAVVGPDDEIVRVLAPLPPAAYAAERSERIEADQAAIEAEKGRAASAADRRKIQNRHPATVLDALLRDTSEHLKEGWSVPPGARWLRYVVPASSRLEDRPASRRPVRDRRRPVECVVLGLASDTAAGTLLPRMSRALAQGDLLHQALASRLDDDDAAARSVLLGIGDDGRPLRGHRHAHFIPLDLDEDGRMDHVLVWAPAGIGPGARRAIERIRRLWSKGIRQDIVATVAGAGTVDLMARDLRRRGGRPEPVLGLARRWSSRTPLVLPRYVKKRRHTPEAQVRAELESRRLPDPAEIRFWDRERLVGAGFLDFVRARRPGRPQPPSTRPWGVDIVFTKPVQGPIALGYGSHHGLGLMEATCRVTVDGEGDNGPGTERERFATTSGGTVDR
ncbi:MAG: type I-U CRISPR-associated protein Csb2, partial [Phycisphaeraceae bacterium]